MFELNANRPNLNENVLLLLRACTLHFGQHNQESRFNTYGCINHSATIRSLTFDSYRFTWIDAPTIWDSS
jgi:hypothetical protein